MKRFVKFEAKAEEVGEIYNVYVVDNYEVLVGYLPLKKLILANGRQKVRKYHGNRYYQCANRIWIRKRWQTYSVATILYRCRLWTKDRKLVGRITIDDIVDVMEEEASEDIQKMAGIIEDEEIRETSAFKISIGRLPWLLVGFIGQLFSALVLETISKHQSKKLSLLCFSFR